MNYSAKTTKKKVLEWIGAAILALFIIGIWPSSEIRIYTAAPQWDDCVSRS